MRGEEAGLRSAGAFRVEAAQGGGGGPTGGVVADAAGR